MTCKMCDIEPGISVTIYLDGESGCINCSYPCDEIGNVGATYEGHVFIDGILYARSRYDKDRKCPECGDTKRYSYIPCDDGGFSESMKKFSEIYSEARR